MTKPNTELEQAIKKIFEALADGTIWRPDEQHAELYGRKKATKDLLQLITQEKIKLCKKLLTLKYLYSDGGKVVKVEDIEEELATLKSELKDK
jgi:hypothetical protein